MAYPGLLPNEMLESVSIEDRRALWLQRFTVAETAIHLVAEFDGVIIAFASFGPNRNGHELEEADTESDQESAEVYAIYALSECWRRGVGTLLMQAIVRQCQLDGYCSIVVWVLENNTRARKFYEALAMKLDRREVRVRDQCKLPGVRYRLDLGSRN